MLAKGRPFNPWPHSITVRKAVNRRRDLSDGDKVLYHALLIRAGKDGNCFPGYKTLADDCGVSEAAIKRRLGNLRRKELIRSKRGNRTETNRYEFLYHPMFEGSPATHRQAQLADQKSLHERSSAPPPTGHLRPARQVAHDPQKEVSQSKKEKAKAEGDSLDGRAEDFTVTNRPTDGQRSLRSRTTDGDIERLADYITRTGRRCDERFAGEIVEAAPRAPSVEALIELFKEKTASGHGPRKHSSCGWFKRVAEDHFGDPEKQGIAFKSVNPLTGIPTDPDEFLRFVEQRAV